MKRVYSISNNPYEKTVEEIYHVTISNKYLYIEHEFQKHISVTKVKIPLASIIRRYGSSELTFSQAKWLFIEGYKELNGVIE